MDCERDREREGTQICEIKEEGGGVWLKSKDKKEKMDERNFYYTQADDTIL